MGTITRRQITSGGDPLAEARAARPKPNARNTPRRLQNLHPHQVTFEALDGVTNLSVKIALLPEGVDPKHDELAEKAILALGRRDIQFRNGFYVTDQADVIAWLKHRIKHNLSTSFREYVPAPKVVRDGAEATYTNERGERLMTFEEFLSLKEQIDSYGLPDPEPISPQTGKPIVANPEPGKTQRGASPAEMAALGDTPPAPTPDGEVIAEATVEEATVAPAAIEEAPAPAPAKSGSKKRGSNGSADN